MMRGAGAILLHAMNPRQSICTALLVTVPLAACSAPTASDHQELTLDVHSFAEPNRVRVKHVSLELALDPERRVARGSATLRVDRIDPDAPLVLDTHGLVIEGVTGPDGAPRPFAMGDADEVLGVPLRVTLAPGDETVTVAYETTPGCEAMQWLEPEQTADGTHPFLFTQGQSILTRSWIPLQDSPGVRITYDAGIRAPEGLTPVMSAEQLGPDDDGVWRFSMRQAIPPYLIALACGKIEFQAISPRCGVWAEPSIVAGARDELEDTEAMILHAERLFGPYRWERYDVIVLPPAFPFGGMENPRLTFATPTILAGDKSLVALVAHELAHSWSGNLVTNATWSDFWLNEGFTVYLEQRIMEEVFGPERSDMEKQLELDALEREMAEMEPWEQVLHVDLAGKHPDDGFSGVPYEKGALFLRRLEAVFGRERLDAFLGDYFDAHAFQSITTAEFEAYLERELLRGAPELAAQVDVRRWLHEPGLPETAPRATTDALTRVERAVDEWKGGKAPAELDTRRWITQQWLHFLETLPTELTPEQMAELDRAFAFTESGNSEILASWLRLSIRHGYSAADERLEEFLMTVGRRKFLKPLYTELAKTEPGKARARAIYDRARPRYHAVSTGTIDGILE